MSTDSLPAVPEPPPRWPSRRVLIFLIPLFLYYAYPIGFWPRSMGANESAHAYLAMALYLRGETRVDEEVRDYLFNQDLILRDGHLYSNKAPGPALWLVPAAAAIDLVSSGRLELVPLAYFGRLLMLTLPFVIFLFFLGRALERFAAPAVAWGLTLAYALGTNAGVYATHYFGHDLAAMAHATGLLILLGARHRWRWLGGLAVAFGVLCEYQTLGMAVVLTILAFFAGGRLSWKSGFSFLGVALPLAVFLILYNFLISGSTVALGYETEFKDFGLDTSKSLGFSYPSPVKLGLMLVSPALGLFFHSPWLLLVIPAVVAGFRRPSPHRRWLVGATVAAALFTLTIASHEYWVGDAIAGPRYLTAALPFLLFPLAPFLDRLLARYSTAGVAGLLSLVVVSIALFASILAVTPYVYTEADHLDLNPLTSLVFPLMRLGIATLTVANVLGAGVGASATIHVLLLLAALAGFAVPWLLASRPKARYAAALGVVLGAVLFGIWTRLGSDEGPKTRFHLNRMSGSMALANQPRLDGRIRFLRRAQAIEPVRIRPDVRRDRSDADTVIPQNLEVHEVARDFKSLFDVKAWGDGTLLVSDMENNTLYRYAPPDGLSVFRDSAGTDAFYAKNLVFPGVSGLALDRKGRPILAEAGRRRVTCINQDGTCKVLAERFAGKRLNSPRTPVVRSDGSVFFTDPPFGLNGGYADPYRELDFCGIYRKHRGKLTLINRDLTGPTGLAFSPDEKHLYVADLTQEVKQVLRFDVDEAGHLSKGIILCRFEKSRFMIPTVGLLVDRKENLYVTCHPGLWILTPGGQPLARIRLPNPIHGLAWAGEDDRTLYLAAHASLYRMRVKIPGVRR